MTTRGHRLPVLALSVALLCGVTAGCGGSPGLLVEPASPAGEPYDGPLYIEGQDEISKDPAKRRGAAALVVECDGTPAGYVNTEPDTLLGVSRTPAKALAWARKEGLLNGLTSGYRVEREEPTRVLFTADIAGRTKQAVIMHYGPSRFFETGWYLESWARCNLAELPEAVAKARGVEIWTDAVGRRRPTTEVHSFRGGEHCSWEHMTFLVLGDDNPEGFPTQVYVANADADLGDYFAESYEANLALPRDAVDTGYQREGRRLWLSADEQRAYVGQADSVERWPRTIKQLACA